MSEFKIPKIEYTQDGPEAQAIVSVIPYYPFHGVPRFYDISGMLHHPDTFQKCIDIFVQRYTTLEVDCIAGLDARGFILGIINFKLINLMSNNEFNIARCRPSYRFSFEKTIYYDSQERQTTQLCIRIAIL